MLFLANCLIKNRLSVVQKNEIIVMIRFTTELDLYDSLKTVLVVHLAP